MSSTLGEGVANAKRVTLATPEGYHSIEPCRVSNSMLKCFAEDPESCWEQYVAKVSHRDPTPSMLWGTAFEKLVFYDKLDAVVIPTEVLNADGHRKGAKWVEWKERQAEQLGQNVPLLTQKEWDSQIAPLLIAREKVRQHAAACKLLYGKGEPHVTYVWDDVSTGTAIPCKCQLDIVHGTGALVDLKSAQQQLLGSRMAVSAQINKFRYHWQAWWYRHAHFAVTGKLAPFVFVFVGNKAPHTVQVVTLNEAWYELAETQIRTHFGMLAECWRTNVWRPVGYGEVQEVSPPKWAADWAADSFMFDSE